MFPQLTETDDIALQLRDVVHICQRLMLATSSLKYDSATSLYADR